MLAANVAFLAIQGVIVVPTQGSGWIDPCPAQIASSISLVFSIGSIVTGLLLIRRNRTMATQDTKVIVRLSCPFCALLADWLPVGLPQWHEEVLLSPRAPINYIQSNICSSNVVVRLLFYVPRPVVMTHLQRRGVFCCPITVLLPENDDFDSYLHGSCRWYCHCPYTLVHHQFMGLGRW